MCSSTDRYSDSEAKERPYNEDRKAGTIGLSGQMCVNLRCLVTQWIMLSRDSETGKILVELQDYVIDNWVESTSEVHNDYYQAVGAALRALQLSNSELVSINGTICRGLPLEQVQELLFLALGDFSIIFLKPNCDEWIKKVLILKPLTASSANNTSDGCDPSMNTPFWADLPCTTEPEEHVLVTKETQDDSSLVGITTITKELCLGLFPASYPLWMQHTPLEAGDRILAVNDKPFIRELAPQDAQSNITTIFCCSPSHISLLVWTPPSKRNNPASTTDWHSALRRGVVAVSGGVMVGAGKYQEEALDFDSFIIHWFVCQEKESNLILSWGSCVSTPISIILAGAILMVTPLHPIGHAMAIGGVGVLGTEFEAPRRAARLATSRISNAAKTLRQSISSRRASQSTSARGTIRPDPSSTELTYE